MLRWIAQPEPGLSTTAPVDKACASLLRAYQRNARPMLVRQKSRPDTSAFVRLLAAVPFPVTVPSPIVLRPLPIGCTLFTLLSVSWSRVADDELALYQRTSKRNPQWPEKAAVPPPRS